MTKGCLTCARLNKCKTATAEMVEVDGYCELWEEADEGIVPARQRIIREFGYSAVLHVPNPPRQLGETRMAVARRTLLRKLAIKAGLLKPSPKSFTLQTKDLVEMLEEKFPGIDEMEDDEIEALYGDIEGSDDEGGESGDDEKEEPKPKRGRGKASPKKGEEEDEKPKRGRARRGKAPAKEEPPEEPEDDDAGDDDDDAEGGDEKPKRGRGRASRGRGGRAARGRTAAPKTEEKAPPADKGKSKKEEPAKASDDLKAVISRLDDIGPMAAQAKDGAEAALAKIEQLEEKLDVITAYLTWHYNEGLYDEDGELFEDAEEIDDLADGPWASDD